MKKHENLPCSECLLKENSIFKNCKESETNNLLADKTFYEFEKNEELIKQNTAFKNIICIQSGFVKVFRKNKDKNELIFRFAKPGDTLGLESFISKENYSFSAVAITAVKACVIDAQGLKNIIAHKPDFSIEIMKQLCDKIGLMENRTTSIAQKDIKGQLAEVLLLSCGKIKSNNKELQIDYTIKDLANVIGTTPNYIYKILSDLSLLKIIKKENKKIKIIDAIQLSQIASGN